MPRVVVTTSGRIPHITITNAQHPPPPVYPLVHGADRPTSEILAHDVKVPNMYYDAVESEQHDAWKAAMRSELDQLHRLGVYEVVDHHVFHFQLDRGRFGDQDVVGKITHQVAELDALRLDGAF